MGITAGVNTSRYPNTARGWVRLYKEDGMDKERVMCSYCGRIVMVDKRVVDKLGPTTAFCCNKCDKPL